MEVDHNPPPSYVPSSLPAYTLNARSNEHIVSINTSIPTSTSAEYQYKNGRLTLNLGPKVSGVFRPVYGWNDTINGYVQVKKNTKHVRSIIITVEGHVTTGLSERGFLTDQTRTTVLRISQTLFDSSEEQIPIVGVRYSFSFPLPSYVTAGTQPLPPTFAAVHVGVAADVTYFIRVEMIRQGKLRQNERVKAFFYYLPRTYAPPRQLEISSLEDVKSIFYNQSSKWHCFEIPPILPRQALSTATSGLSVSLALPRPLVYAPHPEIPFLLTIASGVTTEAISSLFSSLSVQLVRVTILQAGSQRTVREAVLGGGDIFRIIARENTRILCGNVTCTRSGESSWRVEGIEVKYVIRVCLSPRKDVASLACMLPRYWHEVVLTMKSHQQTWLGDEDATMPALCRIRPGGL